MWITAEYRSTGRGHRREGVPCQDCVRSYHTDSVHVIALADGAGSVSLSQEGAEAVLERISRELGDHFAEYYTESDAGSVRQRLYEEILLALEDAQQRCRCELRELSSTLLAVVVSGSKYFITHIGDGVIGYLKNGRIEVASRPDNGEWANETVFTTSPSAVMRMRVMKGNDDGIDGFVLMSDGTEHALYDKRTGTLTQSIQKIMRQMVFSPEKSMERLLQECVEDAIVPATQDDCSLSFMIETDRFPSYRELPERERENLLQIRSASRNRDRRIRQIEQILQRTTQGATMRQIASSLYIKPKYVIRKLEYLQTIGLLDKEGNVYYSAPYAGFTEIRKNPKTHEPSHSEYAHCYESGGTNRELRNQGDRSRITKQRIAAANPV